MLRLLVVDDECEVVDGIYELIREAAFPGLEILKADMSKEAVKIIKNTKIDILLTDICMPGTNGIQLAEITRNNWPKCRVIFLTGYDDFNFAYSAIKTDCEDYR